MRGIDQTLVDEVWRETTSYPPGRIDEEARAFLSRQPHAAAFARAMSRGQEPVVERAALGICFLLFKILDRSLGRPFPRLAEERIATAYEATAEWLDSLGGGDPARVLAAATAPGHPTLVAYILSVFYGDGADGYDEQVRASLFLMLRTLTDALDLGQVEA